MWNSMWTYMLVASTSCFVIAVLLLYQKKESLLYNEARVRDFMRDLAPGQIEKICNQVSWSAHKRLLEHLVQYDKDLPCWNKSLVAIDLIKKVKFLLSKRYRFWMG